MVKEEDLIQEINGYVYMTMPNGSAWIDVVEYSPFTGKENPKTFFWELQHKIANILRDADKNTALEKLCKEKHLLTNRFNVKDVPLEFISYLNDREWFENETKVQRQKHTNSENLMCDGLHFLIDSLYSEKALPLLATVPIKYCPFCGIELPQEFRTENWWEKEFKTFKWWKDRGLCE